MSTDLVPSVSIEAIIERRNAAAERIREMHRLYLEAHDVVAAFFGEDASRTLRYRLSLQSPHTHRSFDHEDGAERLIKAVDASAWDYLLDKSGLRSFMDATARKEWAKAIDACEVPELSRSNIEATFEQLHGARGAMFERGVIALFRQLSWDYQTNSPVRFGKRIIKRMSSTAWSYLCQSDCDWLDDLIRVFSVLDGKPEPDHRQGAFRQLYAAGFPRSGVVDLGYLTVKGHKNGNAHVTFARPDLVDQMNRIIAKHHPGALPPTRGAS